MSFHLENAIIAYSNITMTFIYNATVDHVTK